MNTACRQLSSADVKTALDDILQGQGDGIPSAAEVLVNQIQKDRGGYMLYILVAEVRNTGDGLSSDSHASLAGLAVMELHPVGVIVFLGFTFVILVKVDDIKGQADNVQQFLFYNREILFCALLLPP